MSEPEPVIDEAKSGLPRWLTALLIVLVIGGGGGGAYYFIKTQPKASKMPEKQVAPTVVIHTAEVSAQPVSLQLQGTVMPARRLILAPEVGGRILWHSEELVVGGMVSKGDRLVRINPQDYALALQQRQSQVTSQKLALDVERSRREVAKREWQLFQQDREEQGKSPLDLKDQGALAQREPFVKSSKVAVDAAKSGLAQAQLQLSRTMLSAPFNAFVQLENVEIGQLVSPGFQLATLVGTDSFWVQVAVPVDKLRFVILPDGDRPGSDATVWLDAGDGRIERSGKVIRLLGDLDPVGRMARILVEIPDPFGVKANGSTPGKQAVKTKGDASEPKLSTLPMLLGSFVHVDVAGHELSEVVELPRPALQPESKVHLLDKEDKLRIQQVQVIYSAAKTVLVQGLAAGDRVILTPLAAPVAGMPLRVAGSAKPRAPASAEAIR